MKKIVSDGYIVAVSANYGEEITDSEYNSVMEKINSAPTAPAGYRYQLKTDLTWELCELPVTPEDTDQELTAEETLDIIVGGGSNA